MSDDREKDYLDYTIREMLGTNGQVANYDREDGVVFVLAQADDAVELTRWLKCKEILQERYEYENLLQWCENERKERGYDD